MFGKCVIETIYGGGFYRESVFRSLRLPFVKKIVLFKHGVVPFAVVSAGAGVVTYLKNTVLDGLYGCNVSHIAVSDSYGI
jgi:hypothetical protein